MEHTNGKNYAKVKSRTVWCKESEILKCSKPILSNSNHKATFCCKYNKIDNKTDVVAKSRIFGYFRPQEGQAAPFIYFLKQNIGKTTILPIFGGKVLNA